MRISRFQRKVVVDAVSIELGKEAKVFLFGSRTDDAQRGGDIDLFVEIPSRVDDLVRKKLRILSRIQRQIGEQKIDLIITHTQEFSEGSTPLIIRNARKNGILL